ncbi:MAG: dephospho-CoA kinase, partial [Bacteroidia bacterium]
NNKQKLSELNALVHPAVGLDFKSWIAQQNCAYIIKEAAIIFEIGAENQYDKIILITAPLDVRIKRVMARDGSSREQVNSRITAQLSDNEKAIKADYIINNTSLTETKKQVELLHKLILSL